MAAYGREKKNENEGDDLEIIAQDDDTEVELDISNHTLALLFSYAQSDKVVHTLGYYKSRHHFAGDLDSQNATLDGQRLDYNGVSSIVTLGSMLDVKENIFFGLEIAYEDLKWQRTSRFYSSHLSANFGFRW